MAASRFDRVHDWIGRECTISGRQVSLLRLLLGLFGLYAYGVLLQQGYPGARSGAVFNLPLVATLGDLSPTVHRTIVLATGPLSALLLLGLMPVVASLILAATFGYIVAFDHMGFRHIWVFLANLYLLHGVLELAAGKAAERPAGRVDRWGVPYALLAARGYVALVYLIAGTAKLNASFLAGEVIDDLNSTWQDGLPRALLKSLPWALPAAAFGSAVTEIVLGVGLFWSRLRPVALALGFAFHVAVPVLGKVAPDLNFIFVVTYLFFAFRPAERRPVVRLADGSPLRLWGPRLDLLGRIDWRAGAGEASRIEVDGVETALSSRRGVATLAFQVVGMNPFFLVYVPFWIYFLLPVEPWPWANQPAVAALSLALIPGARWLVDRRVARPGEPAAGPS